MKNLPYILLLILFSHTLLWGQKTNKQVNSAQEQFINNYYTHEIYTPEINKNNHNLIKKVALNWQLELERKGYYNFSTSNTFWDDKLQLVRANVKTLKLDSIDVDTSSLSNLSFYVFDYSQTFGSSRYLDKDICMRFKKVEGWSSSYIGCLAFNPKFSKITYTEKPNYFILGVGNQSKPYFYYLSKWFFSYNHSISKLWMDFYYSVIKKDSQYTQCCPDDITFKERHRLKLPVYLNLGLYKDSLYYDYFRIILESDYRPENFQLMKQKKEKVIFRFYSKMEECFYKLEFDAIKPYKFEIKKSK